MRDTATHFRDDLYSREGMNYAEALKLLMSFIQTQSAEVQTPAVYRLLELLEEQPLDTMFIKHCKAQGRGA